MQTDGQTEMTKLIVAFRDSAKALKKLEVFVEWNNKQASSITCIVVHDTTNKPVVLLALLYMIPSTQSYAA
jgi:hypothetical protein